MSGSPGRFDVDLDSVQGQRAGLITRAIAFSADAVIVVVSVPAMFWGFSIARGLLTFSPPVYPSVEPALTAVITTWWTFVYFAGWWAITGRTLGQAVLGLRVVSRGGGRVRVRSALVRAAVMMATVLLVPIWLIVSRKRLALHDVAARTQIVYDQAHKVAEIDVTLGARPAPTG